MISGEESTELCISNEEGLWKEPLHAFLISACKILPLRCMQLSGKGALVQVCLDMQTNRKKVEISESPVWLNR